MNDQHLVDAQTAMNAADAEIAASTAALVAANLQATALQLQLKQALSADAADQTTIAALTSQLTTAIAALNASKIAIAPPAGLKALFVSAGWTKTRYIGALQTWWTQSASHNSVRRPRYDLTNKYQVADVVNHWKNDLQLDGVTPDSYPVGSNDHAGLLGVLPELVNQGMLAYPTLDHGLYDGASSRQTAIQSYLNDFVRAAYAKLWMTDPATGKKLVAFFESGSDAEKLYMPGVLAALAADKQNSDLLFINNVGSYGGNQMGWPQRDLVANVAWWIRTYAARPNTYNIPALYKGFDDTDPTTGVGCWGANPARVWSVDGKGPGVATLLAVRDAIVAGYAALQLEPDQVLLATVNDHQEGTDCEGTLTWNRDVLGW